MTQNNHLEKSFFLLKSSSKPEIGFTTGTCAAAASVAAARMCLTQKIVPYVVLTTPKGIKVFIEIENQIFTEDFASCSVRKYAGTDPDVTDGIEIYAKVRKLDKSSSENVGVFQKTGQIFIKGGEGVGRVTLPGLDQKPGESAINSVPRKMIFDGVKTELERAEVSFKNHNSLEPVPLEITISVPDGEEIAKKTFNPKLGITGGISILGTSGIVEPMSEQALLDTIKLEINVRKSQGFKILPIVPGNYGADFLKEEFGFSVETAVHCSNFVYDSLQMAVKSGFKKILFCGHIGKLVKVADGIKNTHSKYGDHRMEIILKITEEFYKKGFVSKNHFSSIKKELGECISTEQAVKILDSYDENKELRTKIMTEIANRIQKTMQEWSDEKIEVEVIIFTKETGLLAKTGGVEDYLKELKVMLK